MSIMIFTLTMLISHLGFFMQTYTLQHTETTTLVNAVISKGGFKEIIQFEIKEVISAYKINKVFETLTLQQQESVTRHKQGFKQFIRAIKLAYPTTADSIKEVRASRNDEAKRLICRLANILETSSSVMLKDIIGVGSMRAVRYERIFANNENTVTSDEEKLVYNISGNIGIVASSQKVTRDDAQGALYIYATFYLPKE